jgi:molybdate transport system substrate-binding protein
LEKRALKVFADNLISGKWSRILTRYITNLSELKEANMSRVLVICLSAVLLMLVACPSKPSEPSPPETKPAQPQKTLIVYAGDAAHKPLKEAEVAFEKKTGVKMEIRFMKSKKAIKDMKQKKQGDVFIPALEKAMNIAIKEGVILKDTKKTLCYLSIAIAVKKGNPKNIKTLDDLLRKDVRVGLGKPGVAGIGDAGVVVLEAAKIREELERKGVKYARCCNTTFKLLEDGEVDVVLGWDSFSHWGKKQVEVIKLPKKFTKYYPMPAAVIKFTKDKELALSFLNFLTSDDGHRIFTQNGYTVELQN